MELKVWVEGIQRVVCGATFSTTCQDVVLALAHAMGRTGRFTLVEKWRDTERPLTPAECPLQCLHKWGEYATEVKFYLVQADAEKVKQKPQSNWQEGKSEKMDNYTHNFSPTIQAKASVQSSSEVIKRSSTFSGAHSPNYSIPSSSPQSSHVGMNQVKPLQPHQNQRRYSPRSSSSQHQYQNQLESLPEHVPPRSRDSSQTRRQRQPQNQQHTNSASSSHFSHPLPNGDISLSSASSTSSPRSPSQTLGKSSSSHGYAQTSGNLSNMHKPDARYLHPANLPDTLETHSCGHINHGQQIQQPSSKHNQQYLHPNVSQAPSSIPTPAPRRNRPSSVSPTSQQYENLPPARNSRDSRSSGSSSSSAVPVQPRPRRSASAGRQNSRENAVSQGQHSNALPASKSTNLTDRPVPSQRPAPDGYADVSNSRPNIHNDGKAVQDIGHPSAYGQNDPGNLQPHRINRPNVNDSWHHNRDSRVLPPYSQVYPSVSSPANPSQERSTINQKISEGQSMTKPLSTFSSPAVLERGRRNQGDKVNFVESALLRQQQSGKESFAPSSPGQTNAHQRNRYQRPISGIHTSEHNNHSETHFEPNNFHPLPHTTSSQPTALPSPNTSQPQFQSQEVFPPLSPVNNLLTSPRRHSAFKEVSPRSSRPNSSLSPTDNSADASFVAFNFDDDSLVSHPRLSGRTLDASFPAHSRQASLEIEEYDLDQNFPDVLSKEIFPLPHGPSSANNNDSAVKYGQTHTEYVMDRQMPSALEMEPEYMHLLRQVNMQRERIKIIETNTNEIITEIDALEVEEAALNSKLEGVTSDIKTMSMKEESYQVELADLERVEWVNVVDGELKHEQDLNKQMTSLKDGLSKLEIQIKDMKEEETKQQQEIKQEEEEIAQTRMELQKEEEEMEAEVVKVKKAFQESELLLANKKEELNELMAQISDIQKQLADQDAEVRRLENELHDENLKDFHAHPVPKESAPEKPTPNIVQKPLPSPTHYSADTGEAILKILEEGRSPRMSPAMEEMALSPLTAKNPNGVWV